MSIYQQRAEELVAEYEERRAKAGELRRKIGEITGSATAPRGSVKVTVGVQGEVTALEFPTSAYKRMPPKELAETVLATISEAKGKAVESLRELMTPEMPAGLNFIELLQGKADRVGAAPTEADIPDAVRDYLGRGSQAASTGRSS
jgi:DNA-binding protein YbaB